MTQKKETAIHGKAPERVTSPENLSDYLHVTNPGVWVILAAVVLLLAGLFAWSAIGELETAAPVKVLVKDHAAQVIPLGSEELAGGMLLRVSGEEYTIASAEPDDYGRCVGTAEIRLPDGIYDGTVVTEAVHPISFLLESR